MMRLPGFTAEDSLAMSSVPYKRRGTWVDSDDGRVVTLQQYEVCNFAGTECRIFVQYCKYCCTNGISYYARYERCGWCFGWYDALPCFGSG
jgi:hypothetical protein